MGIEIRPFLLYILIKYYYHLYLRRSGWDNSGKIPGNSIITKDILLLRTEGSMGTTEIKPSHCASCGS